MTEIVRGDGMKYALAYNEFHNLESIGINGKTEKLIKYTYKNGNGRLRQMTYANGHTMKAVYNSIGQMVAEKWFEREAKAASSTATPIAHYKYVYDGEENIVRSIDIFAKKEYNYEYEEGKIVRATEADITLSGEIVTSKVIVNTVNYYYDSEGKMTKKVITPASGSAQTIYYETNDDNTIVRFSAGDRTVTSHSNTDSFGRKVFDELQLGTDFVSRQFVYHAGKVTSEHKTNAKVKSSATTQLVREITFYDGRTISYDYDDEERIIKVSDSVDGTIEYTYDALGQLLTETVNGVVVNRMTYDNYGNILLKNGKQYCYDETWHDLLTCYDGNCIEYDQQGNPIKYLGHTLTWEKGRQLKRFVKSDNTVIDYTYNANGIRTSKTICDVTHTYTLDGTKILREVWCDNTLIPLYDSEDNVCGIIYNNTPYYFIKNLQGDVIAIVNKDAETVARYSYDAWGVPAIKEDSSNCQIASINPFRYRSYYYDEENDLYYLQSRYYDAVVGRFISSDDALFANQKVLSCHNIYIYCYNDAINKVDHTGFAVISLSIASIAAIAKVAVSFFLLAGVIYAITKIVTDRSFQRVLSSANSKIRSGDRSKFRGAIIAILAAYAVAKIQSKKNKYEVHHIVAQTAKKAAPARDVLKHKSVKIGLHSSTNTVSIRYNLHKRLHTDSYYDAINALMIKSFNNGTSGAKERVTAALTSVKTVLSHLSSTTP